MVDRARLRVAAVAVGFGVTLVSCAAGQKPLGGWFGQGEAPTPPPTPVASSAASKPSVYYAGVEGLKVYKEPSSSSQVIGTLSQHEKVTRTDLRRGYALVESAKSGIKGWVVNARLLWRLPAAPAAAAPAPPGAKPEEAQPKVVQPEEAPSEAVAPPTGEPPQAPAGEAPTTAVEPAPEATPLPAGTPPAGAVGPSIFNPY